MVWNGNSSQEGNNSTNVIINLLTAVAIKEKCAVKFLPLLETSVHRYPFFSEHVQKTTVVNTDPCVSKQLNTLQLEIGHLR